MQNVSLRVAGVDAPEPHEPIDASMPSASRSGPRCSSITSAVKRSCPAGTGVCVVNTTCDETRLHASSAAMPSRSIRWRTSSSAAKALWPSFR